jgi:hypothetical protein
MVMGALIDGLVAVEEEISVLAPFAVCGSRGRHFFPEISIPLGFEICNPYVRFTGALGRLC